MSADLTPLLVDWPFVPGRVTVRLVAGVEGGQKLQLRLDLGIMQMELDGRPDGQTPFGRESLFEHYEALAEAFESTATDDLKFTLDAEDCNKLQQEAVQFYHRYLALFQLEDWGRVVRDTRRNLRLFQFVEEYAENEPLGWMFQQFRPYVIMMLTRALAQQDLAREEYNAAIEHVKTGLGQIHAFFSDHHHDELAAHSQEIRFLESWKEELEKNRPLSDRAKLEKALAAAVAREDYETAATLRDSLKKIDY